jgi:hypothetical protein
MLKKDLLIAPVCEGTLVLVMALAAWATHNPLIFTSLGPTAYELVETPERPSARPYNILMGHFIAVLAAFLGVYAAGAAHVPGVSEAGVALPRVCAATIAAALTVFVTLAVHATQPAALSTTLLIALGNMPHWRDGFFIMGAVLLMTALGQPIRMWRKSIHKKRQA